MGTPFPSHVARYKTKPTLEPTLWDGGAINGTPYGHFAKVSEAIADGHPPHSIRRRDIILPSESDGVPIAGKRKTERDALCQWGTTTPMRLERGSPMPSTIRGKRFGARLPEPFLSMRSCSWPQFADCKVGSAVPSSHPASPGTKFAKNRVAQHVADLLVRPFFSRDFHGFSFFCPRDHF